MQLLPPTVGDRHVLTCNGHRAAQPTGSVGEFVRCGALPGLAGGVGAAPEAFRSRPLTFDLVDTWMGRSMGLPVPRAHRADVSYDTFPVNAYEAEARWLARFFRTGHTPGDMKVVREERNPDLPFTLDLRSARPGGRRGSRPA